MEILKVNETPRRTVRSFNINNVKLDDVQIPSEIEDFDGMNVRNESQDIIIENSENDNKLVYGLGNTLTDLVKNNSNKNLKITVMNNSELEEDNSSYNEVEIDFDFNEKNKNLVESIEIEAEEDTYSTIILKYASNEDFDAFHNGIIKTSIAKNAEVNIILVNLLGKKSNNFIAIENTFEENSKLNYTIVDFGGKNSITNYYSNMIGKNSDNRLNTIYLGNDEQLFDLNYIGELKGEKTNINIDVQGALKDKAKKHFKGTIDFKKGCKKATGNENEACMLLSDTAKSLALPMLLCSEEDVEGNHSSSAGKAGEKELFYIMSRGFSYKEAMKLLVRAKFNQVLENIESDKIKAEILKEIDEKLD